MLSIFPLTDTVILRLSVPALTVISAGQIVCAMTMDTSQQPAVIVPEGSTRGENTYHTAINYLLRFHHLAIFHSTFTGKIYLNYGFAFLFYFLS